MQSDSIALKREKYHFDIRREYKEQIFREQRQTNVINMLKYGPEISLQSFIKCLQQKNIEYMYLMFQNEKSDVQQFLEKNTSQLYNLLTQNIYQLPRIHMLALLIIYCYEDVVGKIYHDKLSSKIVLALDSIYTDKNDNRIHFYLWCIKNLVIKKSKDLNRQTLLKQYMYKWWDHMHHRENFIYILTHLSEQFKLDPIKIFPVLQQKLIKKQENSLILLAPSAIIILNLIRNNQFYEYQQYYQDLILTLKYIYKPPFTAKLKLKALQSFEILIQSIPEEKIYQLKFGDIIKQHCLIFFYVILQIQGIKMKTCIYRIFNCLLNKLLASRNPLKDQIFSEICDQQFINYNCDGLSLEDNQLKAIALKNIQIMIQQTDPKLKLCQRIFAYQIKIDLQNLVYHSDKFISERASYILEMEPKYEQMEEQY